MVASRKLYEDEGIETPPDPQEAPIDDRRLFTQPYPGYLTRDFPQVLGVAALFIDG